MTIDLSQLSDEKRMFLKANPELLKSLEEQIPKQVAGVQKRRAKLEKGKAKWQREIEDVKRRADELRQTYLLDPNLRRINEKFMERFEAVKGGLVCPECGEADKGNKMNGKPWCLKCNSPLIPKDTVEKWKKMTKVKPLRAGLKDEFKKRGLEF